MSELKIKIEKNVPVPSGKKTSLWRNLLMDMQVGDSFLLGPDYKKRNPAGHIMKVIPGWKFCQRREGEGIRVWRIK